MPGELRVDEPAEGVLRLTIANPAKRGALDHAILDGIAQALDGVERRARVVVLQGADGQFSSGYDIGDIPDDVFEVEAEKLVAHPFTAALDALEACDVPTVAALTGHTIGGGLELAVTCDFRVAGDGIRLGMPPARLGLVYSHTGLRRFIDTVGVPRTRELFLRGRYVDAREAHEWALVTEVVAPDEVESAALALAGELVANAPLSLSGNKRVIRELLAAQGELTTEVEEQLIALRRACFASEDFREGVRAFGERRPADWQGR
ncbi:enoyl-CoA hydratase/isomerase family protein [Conexibacter sp. SYSU D00693]|uniref:enoyl-CoA hydratase/isomerase family protein n=1 Tax=Conexibacter sp. SYSU D00693 TaxID=2812560 RepID=UPI00196A8045|nr:enoyl-CoA hydratase-related protein [Conexibacter sp. SYSU D00693]